MFLKKLLFYLLITSFIILPCINLASAQTMNLKNTQEYLNQTAGYAGVSTEASLPLIAARVIQALLGLVGAVFVILFLYGGFLYMTSGGAEEKIKKGKDLIKNAIIGLIIIMVAYSIAYFISTALESSVG